MSNPPHEPQGNGSVPEPGSTSHNGQQPYGVPAQGQQPYGAPVQGQPEKKKKTGLMIGIVVAAVVVLAILTAVILVLSKGGADAKYDSREDFTQKIDQAVEGSSLEHCSVASDTLMSSSLESSLSDQPFGVDDVYLCSDLDLTSLDALMNMDTSSDPAMLMGVYGGEELTTDGQKPEDIVDDLNLSDGDWAVYGKNWVIVSTGNTSDEVKDKVLDKVGGKELTQE